MMNDVLEWESQGIRYLLNNQRLKKLRMTVTDIVSLGRYIVIRYVCYDQEGQVTFSGEFQAEKLKVNGVNYGG